MTPLSKPISPLRQRMIEDMTLRKLCAQDPERVSALGEAPRRVFSSVRPRRPRRRICAASS